MDSQKINNKTFVQNKMRDWPKYIRNLDSVLKKINKTTIVALGIVPYSRLVLALILDNYIIFTARYCKDIKLIRTFGQVICVEERFPKIIEKIRSTGYFLKNFSFQNFIQKLNKPFTIFVFHVTAHIAEAIKEQDLPYIGNMPETLEEVLVKSQFREIVKKLNLPHLKDVNIPREEFIKSDFEEFNKIFNGSFVVQRGDTDVGGEIATFFIHNQDELKKVQQTFQDDERFSIVQLNPYIQGNAYSMIGCTTKHGVFIGPLQTQLIDIKESLRDYKGRGVFVGQDWSLRDWPEGSEEKSEHIVRTLGEYLYQKGFKGIFGIDLIIDKTNQQIYPLECNPRFTGSFPMLSFLTMLNGAPPMDLLHVIEHLDIDVDYNFNELNQDLKFKSNYSHIIIRGAGLKTMKINLPIGLYRYDENTDEIMYKCEALLPWEIENDDEFLVVDSIFEKDAIIGQGATKLFKLIFPVSIANSSYELKPRFAKIVKIFSDLLYEDENQE